MINKTYNIKITFYYYSVHDFHKLNNARVNDKNTFSVFHTNIESLMHNFDSLHNLLVNIDHSFDVIAVSETCNSKNNVFRFSIGAIEGYHDYCGTMGHSLKGGCGIFIKKSLKFIERIKLDISFYDENNGYQTKWVEILNEKRINTLVCVVYRHPKRTSGSGFNDHLEKIITDIKKEKKNIIIAGDFNYCILKYSCDQNVKRFLDTMYEFFYNHASLSHLGS